MTQLELFRVGNGCTAEQGRLHERSQKYQCVFDSIIGIWSSKTPYCDVFLKIVIVYYVPKLQSQGADTILYLVIEYVRNQNVG
jgi:hypothetical protein